MQHFNTHTRTHTHSLSSSKRAKRLTRSKAKVRGFSRVGSPVRLERVLLVCVACVGHVEYGNGMQQPPQPYQAPQMMNPYGGQGYDASQGVHIST